MERIDGVVVCVYKLKRDHPRFAVLKRELNWNGWELVKGRMDGEESPEEAAEREVKEETGIAPEKMERLDGMIEWEYEREGTEFHASYRKFTAEAPEDSRIDISSNSVREHSKGLFLNLRDTKDILSYDQHSKLVEETAQKIEDSRE